MCEITKDLEPYHTNVLPPRISVLWYLCPDCDTPLRRIVSTRHKVVFDKIGNKTITVRYANMVLFELASHVLRKVYELFFVNSMYSTIGKVVLFFDGWELHITDEFLAVLVRNISQLKEPVATAKAFDVSEQLQTAYFGKLYTEEI